MEFLSTSISSQDGPMATQWIDTVYANNPHVKLHDDDRGYHVHEITPQTWTATITAVDQVQTRGGKVSKRTRFADTPDQAAVHKM